ncbi:LysM domain-containing protein [Weissella cibaria]|uniref:LysM peptidoglycan-binding domain-containing protein n=1 Tax=Weissella cibaria TaxID=137591 RepID=UPI000E55222E|nr:LysM domain-containing protein [Weissella cibaria]RHE69289.1 LysM domain-containing protein [Weissella cibaria]RHE75065.1 LysM domain-containing protein [Weissella cibaria]
MSLSINSAKLFKSGKFMMTAAATIAVVASATATTLTSVNADDSVAPAKVTTSQKVEPRENHTYKGHVFDAPIRVETHDIWTANSESVIADNMSKQGIKSVDQLGDYKVVWGDTLSTIAAHFHVDTNELAQRFDIADVNYIAAGITMKDQANINALESQIVHDAQWNGEYNAKVAASQASDAEQHAGASDVANAQAPVANTDAPAQAAKSSDTHVGGASDIINNIADGAKTNQTPVVTPATEASAEAQKPASADAQD